MAPSVEQGGQSTGMRVQNMILAVGMLSAGTINTIASKLQDEIKSAGIPPDTTKKAFDHPAVQTLAMFIGESLCMAAFFIMLTRKKDQPAAEKKRNYPLWTFLPPAMCDMTATTLMYVGLILTYPSVYQMLRGMIVVFTGAFSRIFLGRVLRGFHYFGMFLIIIGTVLVGVSSVINHDDSSSAKNPMVGDFFVVAAQVVAAAQMVVEEKFIGRYNVHPLQVVGNEGLWGATATSIILFILYWIPPVRHIDNSLEAIYQIGHSMPLALALLGSVLSIAFFNYFGISVTKYLSATHRTTIDASRVVLVWIVSLIVGWEKFEYLQLIGFVILVTGTSTFNELFRLPFFYYPPAEDKEQQRKREAINNGESSPLLGD